MHKLAIALITLTLSACVTMPDYTRMKGWPGYIDEHTSEFDGVKEVRLEPAGLYGNTNLYIGLLWTSREGGETTLLAAISEAASFSKTDPLLIKIDDEIHQLAPVDQGYGEIITRGLPGAGVVGNKTIKRYKISKELIKKIIDGEKVLVRMQFRDGFTEGRFTPSTEEKTAYPESHHMVAYWAFSEFFNKVW